ncbi:hypothetical protein [Fulvivirga lutea]|uniref:Uncharacterized protein n=1 Tax=Fulvivirga lutea TaxID=2810512 RepID=A0A974WDD5_9BACT|nr:hypothetical protein [Fulvivirga lutea]QSE95939.1 hypothetical protein JR347_09930 [Fulvivirga lutea]
MKKRRILEEEFNDMLEEHELMVKFRGDNEITIIGAPTNNFISRMLLSFSGVALVSYCLILGAEEGSTVVIGGALLGLIFTATPFLSFYSKKHFKVLFSRQTKQINIISNATGPYKRIDFSNIDSFKFKRVEVDDFVSPDIEIPVTYNYTFTALSEGKEIDLFAIHSKDKSIEAFTNKFSDFMEGFTEKTVKA